MNGSVLVLNASYEYLNVTTLRRAIKLLYKDKAQMLETVDGELICSAEQAHDLPSVIRMNYYIRRPFKEVPLSRRNILERDSHINCVCACAPCNRKKKNMTLEEAEMELLDEPRRPSAIPWLRNRKVKSRKDWGRYLYQAT